MADKAKELVYKVGEIGQDNLIAHVYPPARVIPVTIATGETEMTRGSILYADETGKYKKIDTENKAKARAILMNDVDASEGDVKTFAYATGDFNIHAVTGKSIEEIDFSIINALMDHQIYLSELQD